MNNIPNKSESTLEEQLNTTGVSQRTILSIKTIIACLEKNPQLRVYEGCKNSYQNILDDYKTNASFKEVVDVKMTKLNYLSIFQKDLKKAEVDRGSMRSSQYSPGYAPSVGTDIVNEDLYYGGIVSSETSLYSYVPLKDIVALYQSVGIPFKRITGQSKEALTLPNSQERKGRLFGMSWTTVKNSSAMWEAHSKWSLNKRNMLDTSVLIETTAHKLLRDIAYKYFDAPAYIFSISNHLKKDDYNVKSVIAVGDVKSASGMYSLKVKLTPAKIIDSYILDPRLTEKQQKGVVALLSNLGIYKDKIKNT